MLIKFTQKSETVSVLCTSNKKTNAIKESKQRSQWLVYWSKKTIMSLWRLVVHVTNLLQLIHFDFNKPSFGKPNESEFLAFKFENLTTGYMLYKGFSLQRVRIFLKWSWQFKTFYSVVCSNPIFVLYSVNFPVYSVL